MTQFLLGLQAALVAAAAGLPFLDLSDPVKGAIGFFIAIASAFLGAYLKPSAERLLARLSNNQP